MAALEIEIGMRAAAGRDASHSRRRGV